MKNYIRTSSANRILTARLPHDEDLLECINSICTENQIHMATVSGIGALSSSAIAFYDHDRKIYDDMSFPDPCEIVSLIGNVSLKNGQPICHAHIALSDHSGKMYGGHLIKGCKIFACEVIITELNGEPFERGFDDITGLPLWNI
jgi:hypothetical protein